jgi:hypothetical protein
VEPVQRRPRRLDNNDTGRRLVRLVDVRRRVHGRHSPEAGGNKHPRDHEERLDGGSLGVARQLIHDDALRR